MSRLEDRENYIKIVCNFKNNTDGTIYKNELRELCNITLDALGSFVKLSDGDIYSDVLEKARLYVENDEEENFYELVLDIISNYAFKHDRAKIKAVVDTDGGWREKDALNNLDSVKIYGEHNGCLLYAIYGGESSFIIDMGTLRIVG